jgi:hypothetical protein
MKSVRCFALVAAATVPASMFSSATAFATPPVTELGGRDHIHIGRNLGPTPLVAWIVYIEPAGTPLSVEVPDPGCGFI